ncbi:host attachment protein [Chelativorans sp. AA-79]|uniref:host attachment protein n=1 Tax=Chelativorans sp. AA-79 TaxID=3028735 RepID=UPI0023F62BAF|nr:host attachment protein [Chelativorans sp. AA-79]WEX10810.1 host attachment protein [Chelativorans sp. AA-79]
MKKPRTWILVTDGGQARIVRELACDAETGERLDDLVFEIEHKPLRRIMADRPGRSFESHGARRSAMEYRSDPVRDRQRRFASMLSKHLQYHHAAGEFDRLAVVAEPRMLGIVRQTLPAALREVVVSEIGKDLTKLPADELYAALAGIADHPSAGHLRPERASR